MRDPQARLVLGADWAIRQLRGELPQEHPLRSAHAQKWVDDALLIPFKWLDAHQLQSPRIHFVSSPEEWCDEQLYEAGLLTLALLERANAVGADLKDASAWNVIFDGCRPIFCDLTSLEPMQTHAWWAAGQFVRHFISPLWLARTTGLQARDVFRMNRDGAMPELVRDTLGWKRFFWRCWPLVAQGHKSERSTAGNVAANTPRYRAQLVASLRWMLEGVKPRAKHRTPWGQYTDQRAHYEAQALDAKRQQVRKWVQRLQPAWTLDLGCNNGEFSTIALDAGSNVIALDGDHDAVQSLFEYRSGASRIYPVLAALDDMHSGRGWAGLEHSGLATRLAGSADLVMMLALIHHLSIAGAVHMEEVARFAATCTRRWLIVEWLLPDDPQIQLLCSQRRRQPQEWGLDRQKQAFDQAGFRCIEEVTLPQARRVLALLEKTA